MKNYRRDFLDDPLWVELAREAGIRLPRIERKPTGALMVKTLKKLGNPENCLTITGYPTWARLFAANPLWPARAWVGLLLEGWACNRRVTA